MLLTLAFIAALACLWRGWQLRRNLDAADISKALIRLAAALVVNRLARSAACAPVAPAVAGFSSAVAAGAGLVAFAQVAELSMKHLVRRDAWLRLIFLVSAIGIAISHGSRSALVLTTLLAALAYRWRQDLKTRPLFRTALGGLLLFAFVMVTAGKAPDPAARHLGRMTVDLYSIARYTWLVGIFYVVLGIVPVIGAFVKDPSLGIRTVRHRLALSHLLVVTIPLLLTIAMWVVTTWLGVGTERAASGVRVVTQTGAELERDLRASLTRPAADVAHELAQREPEWRSLRIYDVRGGSVTRAYGAPAPRESLLAGWVAALDTLPASGMLQLGGVHHLAAAARSSDRALARIALVPVNEALAGAPSQITAARLSMSEGRRDPMLADTTRASARRAKGVRFQRGMSSSSPAVIAVGTDRDTLGNSEQSFSRDGVRGLALLHGISRDRSGWVREDFSLRADVTFLAAMLGLYHGLRDSPLAVIPIVLLATLALALLPVAMFNQRLVTGLGRSFTEPVAALRAAATALGEGKLGHRIVIAEDADDELWQTAGAFNVMAEGLERARDVEKQRARLENELELARRIQARLLPDAPPRVAGAEIAGHSESAREVGGDYYDHVPLSDGRVLLAIADVSGKGAPAALLMSAFRAALISQDLEHAALPELAARLNAFLYRSVESGRFVTAFLALLDPRDGRLTFVNAGHNPALLLRASGQAEWLDAGGLILGILPESAYAPGETVLNPGDLLVLYTDGVTEGADAQGAMFGEERLEAAARRLAGTPVAEAGHTLVREVRAFEGETGPADDITVLLARRGPTGAA